MNIYEVIVAGNFHKFKIALQNGANVNVRLNNLTPLHLAVKLDRLNIVKELINKGADVNALDKKGYTPLNYVAVKIIYQLIIPTKYITH